jgi:DNA-binding CsgD family transcriptional regulator
VAMAHRGARGTGAGIRQEQILRLAAAGSTDKEIAAALGIAVPTVRTHLDRFFRQHGVRNRTEAVAVWVRTRVIELPRDAVRNHVRPMDGANGDRFPLAEG